MQEARTIKTEITRAFRLRSTLRVIRHEEAASRREQGLDDLRAGVADVEVVDGAARVRVAHRVPFAACFVAAEAGGCGGGDMCDFVEEGEVLSAVLLEEEPGNAVPGLCAEVAADLVVEGAEGCGDEEGAEGGLFDGGLVAGGADVEAAAFGEGEPVDFTADGGGAGTWEEGGDGPVADIFGESADVSHAWDLELRSRGWRLEGRRLPVILFRGRCSR